MSTLDYLKEEIRTNKGPLTAGLIACGFSIMFAFLNASFALFGILAMTLSCAILGIKDCEHGKKKTGIFLLIYSGYLLLISVGYSESYTSTCAKLNSAEECQNARDKFPSFVLSSSGFTLMLVCFSMYYGAVVKRNFHLTSSIFSRQFGENNSKMIPERWYEKERAFEEFALEEIKRAGIATKQRYEWVCYLIGIEPELYQDDESHRYEKMTLELLGSAPWYQVYGLIERCYSLLGILHKDHFERRINDYLGEAKIGWMLQRGMWKQVGDEKGVENLREAMEACDALGTDDARQDMENAWKHCHTPGFEKDAIASAVRALERVIQVKTGQSKSNLSRIRWPKGEGTDLPPEKLRGVISTLWSYSSDQARHANEDAVIPAKDARFAVNAAALLIVYLAEGREEAANCVATEAAASSRGARAGDGESSRPSPPAG